MTAVGIISPRLCRLPFGSLRLLRSSALSGFQFAPNPLATGDQNFNDAHALQLGESLGRNRRQSTSPTRSFQARLQVPCLPGCRRRSKTLFQTAQPLGNSPHASIRACLGSKSGESISCSLSIRRAIFSTLWIAWKLLALVVSTLPGCLGQDLDVRLAALERAAAERGVSVQ
jgi:hypothetical protein